MTKTRLAFVGAGFVAGKHAAALRQLDDVVVVAVSDPDEHAAARLARGWDAQVYADHRPMFDRGGFDAVFICVPPFAHGPVEDTALDHQVPFFVEKPLAADFTTAARIAARVDAAGVVTSVGYHWRHLDLTATAQEQLTRTPAHLAIGQWLDVTPRAAWWVRETGSGGQLIEQVTHVFDIARVLMGDVASVFAVGVHVDRQQFPDADIITASGAVLTFTSGAIATLAATCLLGWRHRMNIQFVADGVALDLSETQLRVDVGHTRTIHRPRVDPFVQEDRAFVEAVRGGSATGVVSYAEALCTHRVAVAAATSAREGRAIAPERDVVS